MCAGRGRPRFAITQLLEYYPAITQLYPECLLQLAIGGTTQLEADCSAFLAVAAAAQAATLLLRRYAALLFTEPVLAADTAALQIRKADLMLI